MVALGTLSLTLAFIATVASVVCLSIAAFNAKTLNASGAKKQQDTQSIDKLQFIGFVVVWVSAATLTVCCAIIVIALLGGDNTINYVVFNRSNSASNLALLYKVSGLWAGRAGSLMFWAWLISLFNAVVALKAWRFTQNVKQAPEKLSSETSKAHPVLGRAMDSAALTVAQLVLLVFLCILVFDPGNYPFEAFPKEFIDETGALLGNAALLRMNVLLEHWAMSIHPPTLFIGYAGLTIPFAYALAALYVNDSSRFWVDRSGRIALISWLFLGAGIGLGSVWAYMELTFGGYWAWDAVENASLLSWGAAVALIHTMTIYRQRGTFKRWAVMLACLTFSFVIVGTFITRTGIVSSVHAFDANLISQILFGILIIIPLIAGFVGLMVRRSSFADATDESTAAEGFLSRDVAYYLTNIVMVVCMLLLLYMTMAPAIPALDFLPNWSQWLYLGGQTLLAPSYDAVARPIGILFCLIIALCPLLAWRKTGLKSFAKQAWLPAVGAGLVFAGLCVFFVETLLPTYMLIMTLDGDSAQALMEAGPFFLSPMAVFLYYAAMTLVGFFIASLLFFNSLVLLVRAIAKRNLRVQTIGGCIAHLSMGIILVGLIGSSVYTFKTEGYLANPSPNPHAAEAGNPHSIMGSGAKETFLIKNYALTFVSEDVEHLDNGDEIRHTLTLSVEKNGEFLGYVRPQITEVLSAKQLSGKEQNLLHPSVLSRPGEDLFVVFGGIDPMSGNFWLDVRVTPLIWYVWLGFGLLMLGTAIAAFGVRNGKKKRLTDGYESSADAEEAGDAELELDEEAGDTETGDSEADTEADDDDADEKADVEADEADIDEEADAEVDDTEADVDAEAEEAADTDADEKSDDDLQEKQS
ncbi:MAG: cytochrome c biogenesis protein CcsA [Coriobacteriia bacterium]|nr:cytochrome c biogenesis protein CcsA [Coriobacteriia bacterium]